MFDNRNLSFPQTTETYECPACDGLISNDMIFSEVKPGTSTRHVVVHCLHCNKSFERHFASVNGAWAPMDQVTVITDARKLRGIAERVDKIRGTQHALSA